jgi:long-chain acyl-CoA synthetase
LNDSGATVLFVDDAFLKQAAALRAQVSSLRALIHMGDGVAQGGLTSHDALMEEHPPTADAGRGGEDLAGILYRWHDRLPERGDAAAPRPVGERDGMARRG